MPNPDCSELAAAIAEIAFAEASQPGTATLDDVASRMRENLPEITREQIADSIVEYTTGRAQELSDIQEQINRIKREARSDKTIRDRISELEQHLEEGTLPEPDRRPATPSEAIAQLRKMRDDLRKAVNQSEPAVRKRVEKSIERLEKKLASIESGMYVAPVRRSDIGLSKELDRLIFERDRIRRQINRRIQDMKPRTTFERMSEPFNVARAIMTSFDFSAVLRQGAFVAFSHPVRAARSLGPMFRAFASDQKAHQIMQEIESRPNAPLYARGKLFLGPVGSDAKLSAQEEAYMSRWADKIPIVAASQRAYTTFLNKLRADSFDVMIDGLAAGGFPTDAEIRGVAAYINAATGRGTLGRFEQAAVPLNVMFFAPRYVSSRFQMIVGRPFMKAGSARVRKQIAADYARYLIGMGTMYALAGMAFDDDDFSITFDPRSADFGKLRFGNTRLDPLGGFSQVTVLLARLTSGQTRTSKGEIRPLRGDDVPFGGQTIGSVGMRFFRSKLSPMLGTIWDVLEGENVVGEPVTMTSVPYNLLVPLVLQEIVEAAEDQGVPRASAMGLAAIFGVGIQSYQTTAEATRSAVRDGNADKLREIVQTMRSGRKTPVTERDLIQTIERAYVLPDERPTTAGGQTELRATLGEIRSDGRALRRLLRDHPDILRDQNGQGESGRK